MSSEINIVSSNMPWHSKPVVTLMVLIPGLRERSILSLDVIIRFPLSVMLYLSPPLRFKLACFLSLLIFDTTPKSAGSLIFILKHCFRVEKVDEVKQSQ